MSALSVLLQSIFVLLAALAVMHYMGKSNLITKKVSEIVHGKPGCLPVPDLGNVTLYYFKVRGRAEPMRLLLEQAGVPYTQKLYTKENWQDNKQGGIQSGLFPFGQVPVVKTTSGFHSAQTYAIMHYLGRATGHDCDCEDYHRCEVVAALVEDTRSKLSKMLYDPGFSMKDRENYLSTVMPQWLGYLETMAPPLTKLNQAFFASDRLTWVDFLVFDTLESHIEFAAYDFGRKTGRPLKEDILEKLPKLNNFYSHFAGKVRISKYRLGNDRLPYTVPNMPKT